MTSGDSQIHTGAVMIKIASPSGTLMFTDIRP
jgi:hypothetical protein